MKRVFIAILALMAIMGSAEAKRMSDLKIYINPGHGGYDSDDRPILIHPFQASNDTLGYWESKSNLYKGLHMYHILDSLGAKAYLSRTKNTTNDDRNLSDISSEANNYGVDLFFSIHSNAGEDVNYPLILYREQVEGTPRYPGNVTLSKILWRNLHSNKMATWTRDTEYISGDLTFYKNMWQGGLGVLRNLYVVGLLSEGGMHEHRPEAHRLMNDDYCWLEAWHFVRTIMEYFETEDKFVTGNVAGIVYDDHNKREFVMPWKNHHAYGRDVNAPLNFATVELRDMSGNVVQRRTTDDMYNGVFVFRNVKPGNYKLYSVKDGYYAEEKDVTVTANEVTYQDMPLNLKRPGHLEITSYSPVMTNGEPVSCSSPIAFTFNYDVDHESLEKNIQITPALAGRWVYSDSYHKASYVPDIALERVTEYTITVPVSVKSADKYNPEPGLAEPLVFKFNTRDRSQIEVIGQYPTDGGTVHFAKPTIEFRFDNKIDAASMRNNFSITNSAGKAIGINSRLSKFNQLANGFGNAQMVLSEDLTPGEVYTVTVSGDLRDADKIPLVHKQEFTFTANDVTADASADAVVFDNVEDACNFAVNTERTSGTSTKPTATNTTQTVIAGLRSANFSYSFANFHDGVVEWDYTGEAVHFNSDDILSLYINGDLNNHELYAIMASGTNRKYIPICNLDFRGWKRFDLNLSDLEEDWCPFNFAGLRLVQTESPSTQKGSFQVDEMARVISNKAGIEDLVADGITVTAANGTIAVAGPDKAVSCRVYGTDGRLAATFNVGGQAKLPAGVYLLSISGKTVKVSL